MPNSGMFRDMNLIVAEDDRVHSFALKKYSDRIGCRMTLAGNGRELLGMMNENTYTLVLMDIEMPQMDGIEAARRIRGGEGGQAHRTVPVIAMTAHSSGEYREKFTAAGIDGYLGKPVTFADFEELLRSYAQPGSAGAPEAGAETGSAAGRKRALERVRGNELHLRGLETIFLEDLPPRMNELTAAVGEGDYEGTRKAAHSIKGASLAIGAERCADAASALEKAAAEMEPRGVKDLHELVKRELDQVLRELSAREGDA